MAFRVALDIVRLHGVQHLLVSVWPPDGWNDLPLQRVEIEMDAEKGIFAFFAEHIVVFMIDYEPLMDTTEHECLPAGADNRQKTCFADYEIQIMKEFQRLPAARRS